ncbi:MAG: hypothetical protein Q7W45_03185 [Bacteroidota bacterium]|nr:hypothetical protein [Bacteroidota bacterium]MDP3145742.1 hypothetical protein [Bacteroidota bacterium]
MKISFLFIFTLLVLLSCTKKTGRDPLLAYSDYAMLDSINAPGTIYYKNNPAILSPAGNSPHGNFQLRFNAIGFNALTDGGKLPVGGKMPDGSLVIKDIYEGNALSLHAFMYKKSGAWIWGEIRPNREVYYSVDKNPSVCTGCHSQPGNRDLVTSFSLH